MDKKKPIPSTLAVDAELRLQVRELAQQNGITALELTNLLIRFALERSKVVKKSTTLEPN